MKKPVIISLAGAIGVGKSTFALELLHLLQSKGLDVALYKEPVAENIFLLNNNEWSNYDNNNYCQAYYCASYHKFYNNINIDDYDVIIEDSNPLQDLDYVNKYFYDYSTKAYYYKHYNNIKNRSDCSIINTLIIDNVNNIINNIEKRGRKFESDIDIKQTEEQQDRLMRNIPYNLIGEYDLLMNKLGSIFKGDIE